MLKQSAVAVCFLLLGSFAFAQDGRFDVSANFGATFTKSSSGNGITQGATSGGGFFATFRFKLARNHSLFFDYGRARNSQQYRSEFNFNEATHISEYSGGYMFVPYRTKRLETFVLAGGGVLKFSPQSTWVLLPKIDGNIPNNVQVEVGATGQTKPMFLFGGGVDYTIPHYSHFALRLQYRGLAYQNPDFNVTTARSTVSFFTGSTGYMSEPSVGLVFRF